MLLDNKFVILHFCILFMENNYQPAGRMIVLHYKQNPESECKITNLFGAVPTKSGSSVKVVMDQEF